MATDEDLTDQLWVPVLRIERCRVATNFFRGRIVLFKNSTMAMGANPPISQFVVSTSPQWGDTRPGDADGPRDCYSAAEWRGWLRGFEPIRPSAATTTAEATLTRRVDEAEGKILETLKGITAADTTRAALDPLRTRIADLEGRLATAEANAQRVADLERRLANLESAKK